MVDVNQENPTLEALWVWRGANGTHQLLANGFSFFILKTSQHSKLNTFIPLHIGFPTLNDA